MSSHDDFALELGRPLSSLLVVDLKAALQERGLATSGRKQELADRLKGDLEEKRNSSKPSPVPVPSSELVPPPEKTAEIPAVQEESKMTQNAQPKEEMKPTHDVQQKEEVKATKEEKTPRDPKAMIAEEMKSGDQLRKEKEEKKEREERKKREEALLQEANYNDEEEPKLDPMDIAADSKKRPRDEAPSASSLPAQPSPAKKPRTNPTTSSMDDPRIPPGRLVALSSRPSSPFLLVTKLMRPFTGPALKTLLERFGSVETFWLNDIKSLSVVKFASSTDAESCRAGLHGTVWPPQNARAPPLEVDFVSEGEAEAIQAGRAVVPVASTAQQMREKEKQEKLMAHGGGKKEESKEENKEVKEQPRKEERKVTIEPATPKKILDELFLKTVALPRLYYLPHSEEEVKLRREQAEKLKVVQAPPAPQVAQVPVEAAEVPQAVDMAAK